MRPAAELVRPGEVIAGKYRVKGVIGEGGVGVVVAAEHMALHRPVAIKFIRPEVAYDADVLRRFLREARATAGLRSEHVARVLDADRIEGGPAYLVMELLEGRDFGAILKQDGPLPVHVAVDYLVQAGEAIAEAHAAGIIHRDLKAANLFLTKDADGAPLVKVLDFGMSKIDASDPRASLASLTSANHVMGSPHYMAPEQMRSSRDADARSDIWALGVVLYAFLAGKVPFGGTDLTEVCAGVLSGDAPPIATLRPEVPAGLAAVIARCMRLEPAERFQSVNDLMASLIPFRQPVPVEARSDSAPTRTAPSGVNMRWVAVALAAAAAVGVALALRASIGHDTGADTMPPVASVSAPVVTSIPASSATETPNAAPIPASTTTRPTGAARHGAPPAAVPRSAAAPGARSSGPKREEDLILGLPH